MIVKITILSNDRERAFLPCVTTCNPSAVCLMKFTFCSVEDLISDKIIYVMMWSFIEMQMSEHVMMTTHSWMQLHHIKKLQACGGVVKGTQDTLRP